MKTKTFCRFVQVLQGGRPGGRHDLIRIQAVHPSEEIPIIQLKGGNE